MTLRIIASGGTFDKTYHPQSGALTFAQSYLPEVLARSRMTGQVSLQELPLLDSLDMQDEDRQRILHACQQAPEKQIVIVHGTDTMQDTAAVLGQARLDKAIVLTGAMVPYTIAGSDALFNFGFACGVASLLPAGVYVAMNGQVFDWHTVSKNRQAGIFESK